MFPPIYFSFFFRKSRSWWIGVLWCLQWLGQLILSYMVFHYKVNVDTPGIVRVRPQGLLIMVLYMLFTVITSAFILQGEFKYRYATTFFLFLVLKWIFYFIKKK